MENKIKRGTGLTNVRETWEENERKRASGEIQGDDLRLANTSEEDDLDRAIQKEAAEYDNENKEDRILGGERASVNDDE